MIFVFLNSYFVGNVGETSFREMYKDVIQVMLENEMNNHLGYDKGSNAVKETDKQKHRFQQTIVY